jgi:hypothetical protein
MPLGLAFGFVMVGVSFEDWLPQNNYSHAGKLRVLCQLRYFVLCLSLAVWRTVPNFRWALSDQKGMSYLAKKKSLSERAYTDHKFRKKV